MKKRYIILIVIAVLLIVLHIALPIFLKNRMNRKLANLDGYHGSVERVGLRLYKGEIRVMDFRLIEEASVDTTIPFVTLPEFFMGIDWSALLKGKIVAQVKLEGLTVNMTKRKSSATSDTSAERLNLARQLSELNPLTLNYLKIYEGKVSYVDPTSTPEVRISLSDINLVVTNISNVETYPDSLPSRINFTGNTYDSGNLKLQARANFLKDTPEFNYQLSIEEVLIEEFNQFFKAYAHLKVQKGKFNLFSEASAESGRINGYVKPVIDGLEIMPPDSSDDLLKKLYKGAVEVGTEILENPKKNRIATRFQIQGDLSSPGPDPWQAALNILRNAFIEAYKKKLEHTIRIQDS
jgi:hypothetical protein